jgi:predicted Zn-dependent peptidase
LANGIWVVTEQMPHVRSVSIGVWVRTGSGSETSKTNGIAHFVEHMLFKGTNKRSAMEIARSLESLGGILNASTGKEISLYTAQVIDQDAGIAIDVLSDLLQNPRFDPHDVELEKSVVLSEIHHAKEDPEEYILDMFYQNIFPDHPLGYFIHGTPENLTQFNRDDLFNYMAGAYTPQQTVFAAAGNIEHQKFVDLVVDSYNPPWNSPTVKARNRLPRPQVGTLYMDAGSVQQAHICIGTQIFGFTDERRYAFILLDILLGGGMSSRLFQNIREKYGFAYAVYTFIDFMKNCGAFGAYMACEPDRVNKSIELLNNEFQKIIKKSIRVSELDRIKSQVRGSIILGLESTSRRMRKIGETEIYQRPHLTLSEVIQRIDSVTVEQVTTLAKEYLNESQLNVTCMTPKG